MPVPSAAECYPEMAEIPDATTERGEPGTTRGYGTALQSALPPRGSTMHTGQTTGITRRRAGAAA
jgi:hypothetical protein